MSWVPLSKRLAFHLLVTAFVLPGFLAYGQNGNQSDDQGSSLYNKDANAPPKQTQEQDPLKRPLTEKQKKANAKALKQEL